MINDILRKFGTEFSFRPTIGQLSYLISDINEDDPVAVIGLLKSTSEFEKVFDQSEYSITDLSLTFIDETDLSDIDTILVKNYYETPENSADLKESIKKLSNYVESMSKRVLYTSSEIQGAIPYPTLKDGEMLIWKDNKWQTVLFADSLIVEIGEVFEANRIIFSELISDGVTELSESKDANIIAQETAMNDYLTVATKPDINNYVETVSKPSIKTYGEEQVDNYIVNNLRIFDFNIISDMVASQLKIDDKCTVWGETSINDNYFKKFVISDTQGKNFISLNNGLYANEITHEVLGTVKRLPVGTDLNDLKKSMVTFCWSSDNFLNLPFTESGSSGFIKVVASTRENFNVGEPYRIEQLYANASNGATYKRLYSSSNVWTEWKKDIYTDEGSGNTVIDKVYVTDEIRLVGYQGSNALIQKNSSSDHGGRDELQIYSSGDAYDTGSRGSGIHLYGNTDNKHVSGGVYILTGDDDEGSGRFSVSKNGNVVIGKNAWSYNDSGLNKAHLTLKYNSDNSVYGNSPAIYMSGYSSSNGEIACEEDGRIDLGHFDQTVGNYTPRVAMDGNGDWISASDGAVDLGRAASKWGTVFASTSSINTSDEREKTRLLKSNEAEKKCALECKNALRNFYFVDAVIEKGENARIHYGIGAQTVESIFKKNGLVPSNYALFCYDEWEDETEDVVCNTGEKIEVVKKIPKTTINKIIEKKVEIIDGKNVLVEKEVEKEVVSMLKEDLYNVLGEKIGEIEVVEYEEKKVLIDAEPKFEKKVIRVGGNRYGIRYEELLCFIVASL